MRVIRIWFKNGSTMVLYGPWAIQVERFYLGLLDPSTHHRDHLVTLKKDDITHFEVGRT